MMLCRSQWLLMFVDGITSSYLISSALEERLKATTIDRMPELTNAIGSPSAIGALSPRTLPCMFEVAVD